MKEEFGASEHLSRVVEGETISSQYTEYVSQSVQNADGSVKRDAVESHTEEYVSHKVEVKSGEKGKERPKVAKESFVEQGNMDGPKTHFGFTLAYQSSRRALWRVSECLCMHVCMYAYRWVAL